MRKQNNLHADPETLNSILGGFLIGTLFILFLHISPSLAVEVSFQTLAGGYRSGIREPLQIVARNQIEWDALWKKHVSIETNPAPARNINFDKEIVVGVFLGEKTTGGYDIEIIRVEKDADALVVQYREKKPLPGAIVTQALTQPFHIIKVVGESNLGATFRRTP